MEEVKQHPRSKRKRKNINVYFNKTKSTGQTKYITGEFQSNKCNSYVPYRSSYELAYLEQLEKDENVINFQYEPISLKYTDIYNKERTYIPDFIVLYKDSSVVISEIKPEAMLKDYNVQAKKKAVLKYIEENIPKDLNVSYKFITETCLFKSPTDYVNFIRRVKKNDYKSITDV